MKRFLVSLCPLLGCLLFAGCAAEEKITREKRERLNILQRFLGAIIPQGETIWFVRVIGPETKIGEVKGPFEAFVRSLEFPDPKRPVWKLPDGWTEEDPDDKDEKQKLRYKNIYSGPKEKSLEVTVTPLGKEAGDVWANINRWRGQIGLKAVDAVDLKPFCRTEMIAGVPATLVDMVGPGSRAKGAPMGDRLPMARPRAGVPFKYVAPENWKEAPAILPSVLSFVMSGGAKLTVTSLPGDGGGVLDNVNRWRREQVDLPAVTQAELQQQLQEIKVSGVQAPYVDLVGNSQRIIAVIVPRGQETFFFKLFGPGEAVGKQKTFFESFVKSIDFGG